MKERIKILKKKQIKTGEGLNCEWRKEQREIFRSKNEERNKDERNNNEDKEEVNPKIT